MAKYQSAMSRQATEEKPFEIVKKAPKPKTESKPKEEKKKDKKKNPKII